MFFKSKYKPLIGLDIGSHSLKLAELTGELGNLMLTKCGLRQLPMEAIVSGEIKDKDMILLELQALLDQCNVKTKNVVFSVSGHAVITDKIVMDYKTGDEAEQAILFEAEQRSPFDTEDVTLDYQILGGDSESNKMEVLVSAAKNEVLNAYLELLTEVGLNPVTIDVDAFAILNAYELNYEIDPNLVIALVNIGFDKTTIVFVKNGSYHSMRDTSCGGRLFSDAVQKRFKLPPDLSEKLLRGELEGSFDRQDLKEIITTTAEELSVDLEVAFSYFRSSTQVEEIDWIALSGGGALLPYLPEFLQNKLGTPIEISNPLRKIQYEPGLFPDISFEEIAPLMAVSIGLASRKVL